MLVAEAGDLRYFFLLRLLRFVIVLRPPSDRIPSAVRSDSVRRPIGLRPPPDWIPSAARRLMLRDKACVTTIIYIKSIVDNANSRRLRH